MTGPSPWRLPSPRWGPDIGHSIWVHDRACWLNNSSPRSSTTILRGRETSSNTVAGTPSRKTVRPRHEPDARRCARVARRVDNHRVRGPYGKRHRTAAVRGRRSAARPPDHHRGGEVCVLTYSVALNSNRLGVPDGFPVIAPV